MLYFGVSGIVLPILAKRRCPPGKSSRVSMNNMFLLTDVVSPR